MVDWKKAQTALGCVADGTPGPATCTALEFEERRGTT
jgi:hypothetical protein